MATIARSRRLVGKQGGCRSHVWKYFAFEADLEGLIINSDRPVCKRCHRIVQAKGGNTSNLAKHLKDKHPDLFREFKSKQNKSATPQEDYEPIRFQEELTSGTALFRTKILSLMESLMVKTTSEIVSIFDEIYMGAEAELIQRRKEVAALTHRLKEMEQLCTQDVCDNLPVLKVEPEQRFLETALFHGQPVPESTETVEFALECVVMKAEEPMNAEAMVQQPEYQLELNSVPDAPQELLVRADEELPRAPVWPAEGAESHFPAVGQPHHHTDQETTCSTATAEPSSSKAIEESTGPRQDGEVRGSPLKSNQAFHTIDQQQSQPAECLEFSSASFSPDAHSSSAPQEPLVRADEELPRAPVWPTEGAKSQFPPMGGQPRHQTDQETTCSSMATEDPSATAEPSSSMATEDSLGARQDRVVSGTPKSNEATPAAGRRRGRSAGLSPESLSAPGITLHLRSRSAVVNTSGRSHDTLDELDSSLCMDPPGTNGLLSPKAENSSVVTTGQETTSHCVSSESETENPSDMEVKSTAVKRKKANSKARVKSGDTNQQGKEDTSLKRSSAEKSEKIPRKKRRMTDPECKHDVNGAFYPFEKILQRRTTVDGQEEVRVKWWPCSSCGAKWRNSWEPA
ncbi:protein mel-28-like isoform X3 [Alosa alosa]|uniref:protein mel-28-like isoform X3 n=1 Tax=Alosa alosa TaxID=278164 RepID=UPI0020152D8B|nr:protein mel-28-like isoform X3 [Alosa alosa]